MARQQSGPAAGGGAVGAGARVRHVDAARGAGLRARPGRAVRRAAQGAGRLGAQLQGVQGIWPGGR